MNEAQDQSGSGALSQGGDNADVAMPSMSEGGDFMQEGPPLAELQEDFDDIK